MTDPLLQVRNLSKWYTRGPGWLGGRRVMAVDDISFDIHAGRSLGLVGESGSGKTTIARLVARLTDADGGTLRFQGADLRTLSGQPMRQMRRHIQIVSQDPATAFDPRVPIGAALTAAMRLHRLHPERDLAPRVAALLTSVGLPVGMVHRFPHQLSGGQVQRLAIARALSVQPALIILDEVVSALDSLVKAQTLDLLQRLQRDLGHAYLFISHNIADVRQVADHIGVLYGGKLVECGSAQDVLCRPKHPYSGALLSAATWVGPGPGPGVASDHTLTTGCAFASRCPDVRPPCHSGKPSLAGPDMGHVSACLRSHDLPPAAPLPDFGRPLSTVARLRLGLLSRTALAQTADDDPTNALAPAIPRPRP